MITTHSQEHLHFQPRVAFVMSEMDILAATVKTTLRDIAKQAAGLGSGLQNAAPGDKAEKPNHSVQYLMGIAGALEKVVAECDALLATSSSPTKPKS